jgi:large subunit ribosomal protein L25
MTFSLTVESRKERGKELATLRQAGKLPAVMYGPKEAAVPLVIDRVKFEKLFEEAGESSIITLKGLDTPKDVLVQEVAFDARRGGPIHVDFYAIEVDKEVTVNVPLEFEGDAPALKLGGTLTKVLYEIEITCLPKDLLQSITVDLTVLGDLDARILVKDLPVPKNVTVTNEMDEVVALVQEVEEETETPVAQVDMNAIEVEKKGKEEGAPSAEDAA